MYSFSASETVARQFRLGGAADVTTVGTDAEGVGTSLGDPLRIGLVEGGEVAYGDRHRENLTLAGLQFTGLGEGLQLLSGLL